MKLQHSAKGSTWKDHKYIKKENGRYYYSVSELMKNDSKTAHDNYQKGQLEKAEKGDSYYKKAPSSLLGKVDWAIGRLSRGIPIDSKEYQVYFRSGKKYVEAVKDESADNLGNVAGVRRNK